MRVRARERVIIDIFTVSIFPLPISGSERRLFLLLNLDWEWPVGCEKVTRRFQQNDPSFYEKWPVGFNKTTCRFMKSDPSVSTKRAVVLRKVTRRFRQNNPSVYEKWAVGFDKTTRRFTKSDPPIEEKCHTHSNNNLFGQSPTSGEGTISVSKTQSDRQSNEICSESNDRLGISKGKNKTPLIWQVRIVKIKGEKNVLLLFGHFFTLCPYFNPYIIEGEWSEEKKMWRRKVPKSRSAFSAWATPVWKVCGAHWLESFVALVQVRPFGGIRHKPACSIAPLRCTS